MASLELRGGAWRVIFRHQGRKLRFHLGKLSRADAESYQASAEELLGLLDRGVVSVPDGCPVEEFLRHRGRPPESAERPGKVRALTLNGLRTAYFQSQRGRLESTTLDGISLHFDHLERVLGQSTLIPPLSHADLQAYVRRRGEEWIDPERYRKARQQGAKPRRSRYVKARGEQAPVRPKRHPSPATLRKEVVSLRTAWNWARKHLGLREAFPGTGLEFAKTEESMAFMSLAEAQRRIAGGENPDRVYECVYLRAEEVAGVLAHIESRPVSPWVYPMVLVAAHTGMRRSEIVRMLAADVDIENDTITVREKKRDHRKLTTRRVPISRLLKQVLTAYSASRNDGPTYFCKANGRAITPRDAHNYFQRAVKGSRWSFLRGWHVFRHSFVSALASKGVDQRVIDDLVGHQTEEQRRRYRHLHPDVKRDAVLGIFG